MKKSGQQGQAMVEMLCGLVGILMLFSALIIFTAVGTERTSNLVTVRSNTARMLASSDLTTGNPGGRPILRWEAGSDQMQMTQDDEYVLNNSGSTVFSEELTMDSVSLADKPYVMNNELSGLPPQNIFWELANLREFTVEGDDIESSRDYIYSINQVFKALISDTDFDVTESNYMYDAIPN